MPQSLVEEDNCEDPGTAANALLSFLRNFLESNITPGNCPPTPEEFDWNNFSLKRLERREELGSLFAVPLARRDGEILIGLESEEGDYSERWFSIRTFKAPPELGSEYHLTISRVGSDFRFSLEPVESITADEIQNNAQLLRARVAGT